MVPDHTPVLVGAGTFTDNHPELTVHKSPVQLLHLASRDAADDAGLTVAALAELDHIFVVKSFRGDLHNPPRALAASLGAERAKRFASTTGGNTPQFLVNHACELIAQGQARFVLIAGAEAIDTANRADKEGVRLNWLAEGDEGEPELIGDNRLGTTKREHYHGLSIPPWCYPLFENALRHHLGRDIPSHQASLGALFARLSAVAANHPDAWFRQARTQQEIATPSADNRPIAFPYSKLMTAMNSVNQSAALLVMSAGHARSLGIDEDGWVYLQGCADAHDHWYPLQRRDFFTSPAIERCGQVALEMAGVEIESIDLLDLYSCFPSAVEITRDMLGIAHDDPRMLTVTGGLPFHGGPGNNYTTHAIATVLKLLRQGVGNRGLVTGNGYYLTIHSLGIYGRQPPPCVSEDGRWRRADPASYQTELDQVPRPEVCEAPKGHATIETYTVTYDRKGAPERGIVVGRLEDDRRFVALTPEDPALLDSMTTRDMIGTQGVVSPGPRTNLFVPNTDIRK